MIALRRADVAELNARARDHMRAAGLLGAIELDLPAGSFATGDQVVVRRNDSARAINNGDRATVACVDVRRHQLALDVDGRRVTLDARFLHSCGQHGEDALQHGYAITGHVAQGSTLRRAYVLAGDGLSKEWGYTALTRGREANYLYVAEEHGLGRAEFAPADPFDHRSTTIERTARALQTSAGRSMAIDSLPPRPNLDAELDDIRRRVEQARNRLLRATSERQRLRAKGAPWMPGRRRAVASAEAAERQARALAHRSREAPVQSRGANTALASTGSQRAACRTPHPAAQATTRLGSRAMSAHGEQQALAAALVELLAASPLAIARLRELVERETPPSLDLRSRRPTRSRHSQRRSRSRHGSSAARSRGVSWMRQSEAGAGSSPPTAVGRWAEGEREPAPVRCPRRRTNGRGSLAAVMALLDTGANRGETRL